MKIQTDSFFEVDKKGLAKLAGRRGKAFVLYELLQNAWDTNATEVEVSLRPASRSGVYQVMVTDNDPEGFKNLTHAWTLFAESEKKGDLQKRGRFNLGEKLVLALCEEALITTTTGSVRFDSEGRHKLRNKTPSGSIFIATLKMTKTEYENACSAMAKLLVPSNVVMKFNGAVIAPREYVANEEVFLMTEEADQEGYLRRKHRMCNIHFFDLRGGEVGTLYEMGIPVCETGDKYHANVLQKIPLNMERDGVSAVYLRDVRVGMLNALHKELKPEESTSPWVRDAFSDALVEKDAAAKVMDLRFGEYRVSYDPSDAEANNIAVSKGLAVVRGGALSAEEWDNAKRFDLIKPAGQVTPSPRPFSPDGSPLKLMPYTSWSPATKRFVSTSIELAAMLDLGHLDVEVANDAGWRFNGCYKKGHLTVNYGMRSMRDAIEGGDKAELLRFVIHEFAHHFEMNHLADGFHSACCRIGGQLLALLHQPGSLEF